jgi:hypothetical protein
MKNHAKEALIFFFFFLISGAPMQGRIGDSDVIGKRWSQNDFFEL